LDMTHGLCSSIQRIKALVAEQEKRVQYYDNVRYPPAIADLAELYNLIEEEFEKA